MQSAYRRGCRRLLLEMPCGSGKTYLAAGIMRRSAAKGHLVVFVAPLQSLVHQCSARLDAHGVDHGIIMSNHPRRRPHDPIQVASIWTLARRLDVLPTVGLMIIDECHLALSDSYTKVIQRIDPRVIVGLSATPERLDGRGLGDLFDALIHVVTPADLIAEGHLVPTRVFQPAAPNLDGVHIRRGDYVTDELAEVMDDRKLIGDLVEHYQREAMGRTAVLYAVNLKHSQHCKGLFEAAGITAAHMDATTTHAEREQIFSKWKQGEIKILCNVNVISMGYDEPACSCVIDAAPTASISRYLQRVGRGSRPKEGKANAILLDHAGNTLRHGLLPGDAREWSLSPTKRRRKNGEHEITFARCEKCFCLYRGPACPECGTAAKERKTRKPIEQADGRLVEAGTQIDIDDRLKEKVLSYYHQRLLEASRKRTKDGQPYKPGWAFYRVVNRFGERVARQCIPRRRSTENLG